MYFCDCNENEGVLYFANYLTIFTALINLLMVGRIARSQMRCQHPTYFCSVREAVMDFALNTGTAAIKQSKLNLLHLHHHVSKSAYKFSC